MTKMGIVFRYIGCLIILVASSGIGINYGEELKRYLNQLEELKKLFCLIKSEMEYTKAPLIELFGKLRKKVSEPYQEWMKDLENKLKKREQGEFWEIWCNSVTLNLGRSKLQTEDLEELKNVGKNLEYIENLNLYIEQLEYKITEVRRVYESKRKLSRTLGIMGGIFLVILLL